MSLPNFITHYIYSGETRDVQCEIGANNASTVDVTQVDSPTGTFTGDGRCLRADTSKANAVVKLRMFETVSWPRWFGLYFELCLPDGAPTDKLYLTNGCVNDIYIDTDRKVKMDNRSDFVTTSLVPTSGTAMRLVVISGYDSGHEQAWGFVDGTQEAYTSQHMGPTGTPTFLKDNGASGLGADLEFKCWCISTTDSADTPESVQWPSLLVRAGFPLPSSDAAYETPSTTTVTCTGDVPNTADNYTITNCLVGGGAPGWATNQWAGYVGVFTISGTARRFYVHSNGTDSLTVKQLTGTAPPATSGVTVLVSGHEDSFSDQTPDATDAANNWDEGELPENDGDTSYNGTSTVVQRQMSKMEDYTAMGFVSGETVFRVELKAVHRTDGTKGWDGASGLLLLKKGASSNNAESRAAPADGANVATYRGISSFVSMPYPANPGNDFGGWGAYTDIADMWIGVHSGASITAPNYWRITMIVFLAVTQDDDLPLGTTPVGLPVQKRRSMRAQLVR